MLIQVLKMRFPGVFGQSLQHFTIDKMRDIKLILDNPPYHICLKNKTLTATFDVSQDLDHESFNLDKHIEYQQTKKKLDEQMKKNLDLNIIYETNPPKNSLPIRHC